MRKLLCLCFCVAAVMATSSSVNAGEAMTTAEFMLKCKSDAGFCRDEIVKASNAPKQAGEACVPDTVSADAMAKQVLELWQSAIDNMGTDLNNEKYTDGVYDAVATLWPCRKP